MIKETLFTNNKSQAVRIPKALEFPEGTKKSTSSLLAMHAWWRLAVLPGIAGLMERG